jgi:hypothetical protein
MLASTSSDFGSAGMFVFAVSSSPSSKPQGCFMSRFVTALFTCIIAIALAGGTALMPTSTEAASISKADKVVLKEAIIACKAEAKGKKVKWLARRKYVNHCVAEALKDRPNIDVIQLLKNHPNLIDLPAEQWDAI